MGVANINHPVGWGVYIGNYIFWVGIAMSGTFVSAMLFLARASFRTTVSRAAETMTLFAISVAGLFPLIHLGRFWVSYFIFPYPSQRQLWPNFISALIWDMASIVAYLTISIIFYYVGLLPDAASARDRCLAELGPDHPRTRLYRWLALGWHGSASQWRHQQRGYLFFAALITPIAISVHSIVALDFGTSLLPGWHTTIYPPYFVAGAVLSGMAMALTLLIPLRRIFGLERIITIDNLEGLTKIIIVTGALVGYTYVIEWFIAWYSGDIFEIQLMFWQATHYLAPWYWLLWILNFLLPQLFLFRRFRRNPKVILPIVLLINVGMWTERYVIVAASTAHDFLPHNWGIYTPSWVEIAITAGAFSFFALGVIALSRYVPMVAISDVKEEMIPESAEEAEEVPPGRALPPDSSPVVIAALFAGTGPCWTGCAGSARRPSTGWRSIPPCASRRPTSCWGAATARCATGRWPGWSAACSASPPCNG